MKIVIFGSTAGTGRHIVEQALAQGHAVAAFARDPAKLNMKHSNLTIVQGDVLNPASVEKAVRGHDAVLSTIGAAAGRSTLRTEGTREIVRAMEKAGVKRFISLSSHGVGDSWDNLTLLLKYVVVPLALRHVFADHEGQERCIRESHLDWTIARPGHLTDGPHTGAYRHGFPHTDKTVKHRISRADVADFMLRQLTDDTYLQKAPSLSY